MKKTSLLSLLCFCGLVNAAMAQLPAFPTAEGAGKFVSGGRGTIVAAPTVLEVTSLVDNPAAANTPGTFRYACTKSGFAQRVIVFRVSGIIHLYAALTLNRANTTIAGQTAPGEGICLADYPVKVSASNVIIRYMRFRLGDKNQAASLGNDDALDGVGAQRVIIDHCSISWSNDEACTFYSGDNITLQWNLISEPLDYSYHDEGSGIQNHSYGGIWGGKHASFHHNLIAHCKGRMPRFDGIRNIPADTGDFRNNVIYNWGDYNTNGGEGGAYNVVNNYYKYGPNTPNTSTGGVNRRNMLINPGEQASPAIPYGRYFLSGNYCDNSASISSQNWKGASFSGGTLADSVTSKVTLPFNCVSINVQSAEDACRDVLALAGCSLPNRDTLDERIVNDVKNRTGRIINVQGGFPAGTAYVISQVAWPVLANGTAQTDSDHDGMPDNWEKQRGLNPLSAVDVNGYISNSGYSNIENYINGDTIVPTGKAGTCIGVKQVSTGNSGQWLWAKDSSSSYYLSTTYTAATDSNQVVAGILDNGNYGSFAVSYYTTGLLRYDPLNAKPYLNRNVTIIPTDASLINTPVTVRLYITSAEFDSLQQADPSISSIADLVVLRSADNNCVNVLTPGFRVIDQTGNGIFGTYETGFYIEFQTATFGTFFIAGKISFPLPLKLISFTATRNISTVTLNWITENEINCSHFLLERSTDGFHYSAIGNISSANTASRNHYSFTSEELFLTNTYYRLKMLDGNGGFSYSQILLVRAHNNAVTINPNPVADKLQVKYHKADAGALVKIINVDGKEMLNMKLSKGSETTVLNTSLLMPGLYFLIYLNNAGTTAIKFLKQ
ncbi:MAG: T9SS type A sorting domain-containing protein [Chitinophagaceae bacterium]|nr:T9SS type A sorting domain-containing protein [Chitinophagaceae bacterium]